MTSAPRSRKKATGSRSQGRTGRSPGDGKKGVVIQLRRAYDPPSPRDGGRVLVDRVWPRGLTRERLKIDAWMRDLGPSTPLRKWFGHDPGRWREFRLRYLRELAGKRTLLNTLASAARRGKLTLVYGARDAVHNQAAVIKEVLDRRKIG